MGYSLNFIEDFGSPFQVVHEQTVDAAANGSHTVRNGVRKLLFVLSGECRHQVIGWNGPWSDVILRPGDILALPHHCEQRYSGVRPGVAMRLHVVRLSFDPQCLPALPLGGRGSARVPDPESDVAAWAEYGLQEIRCVHGGANAALTETLLHLRTEAERGAPGYRPRIHALCVGLTILFARSSAETGGPGNLEMDRPTGGAYHVGTIKKYLRDHLREATRLSDVAGFVGLSEEHVARVFKAATGMTVLEYLRRLRIAESKSLLTATDNNLSEIARRTGFSSLTVFSRNFTRDAGMTPSEYRRQIARQIG
ncbi:MAG: AraC family transcriptional regulator [Armatimonadota bacterium]